jgi:hypothetical protein
MDVIVACTVVFYMFFLDVLQYNIVDFSKQKQQYPKLRMGGRTRF